MAIKNAVGRPSKFNTKTVDKIAVAVQQNYSISDACNKARICRSTYYYYLKNEPIFAEIIAQAQNNANKVSFNFRTSF
ncbi:MAG TPA: hypothetical protein VJR27_04570 [Candidatus Saccharimonadales bacterium]|nr:hypothetical protein [Candidatus Saccharimonadales bacterium]